MNHITKSLESLQRVITKFVVVAIILGAAIVLTIQFMPEIDLPGGLSDQAFHIKADGQEHVLTGFFNGDCVAPIPYSESCAVKNNTPSHQSLIVAKVYSDGFVDTLATGIKYEAVLNGGLYQITSVPNDGSPPDICLVRVTLKETEKGLAEL